MSRPSARTALAFAAALLSLVRVSPTAAASPIVEGPIASPAGAFVAATSFDLAQVGYQEQEYFLSGTASAYTKTAPLGTDGVWAVAPAATADYKTRILVYRPIDAKRFNGTVVVEWLNVSGGVDAAPDWTMAHTELIRDGFAWVGVSGQFAGVEGGGGLLGIANLPLKAVNPARYGSLHHPGDSFSYDMFTQAGDAVRHPAGTSPLGGLEVKKMIAAGESQSAFRLVTYIDAIHPLTQPRLYDGYLVHSRGALGAALSEAPQPAISVPGTAPIRSDVDVPVLLLETETDLTFLGYLGARQDDAKNVRLWEVAGTAHADAYTVVLGAADEGDSPSILDLVSVTTPVPGIISCDTPLNDGPHHFVASAAFFALDRWVVHGKPPKSAPRLDVDAGPPVAIQHDPHGNALGGIRTPQVDVPIAAFTGVQAGSIICALFGSTTPFDHATLAALYPSHRAFLARYNRAVRHAVKAGWVRPADGKLMRRWAFASTIGN